MRIESLFKKPIARPINGVVKADQLDDAVGLAGAGGVRRHARAR